jgi:ABC-2 type transport system ATP-binding protein
VNDIISLEQVDKQLDHRAILKKVSLSVKQGDIFGYLGPNGAGKTTTIRIILGLMPPSSGRVTVLGRDSQLGRVRQKVGFVLETDGLYDNMTATDNLLYYAQLYNLAEPSGKVQAAIRLVGLGSRERDKVGTFSKGMRQRLALARAVMHNPEVLVLDEPTAGVDPTGQIEIRQIMLDMIHNEGKTILLSSHNLDEVQRVCNRIALIHKGQIRLSGELEKLQQEMSHGEVIVETAQPIPEAVTAELANLPGICIREQKEKVLSLKASKEVDVVAFLVQHGVRIEQFKKQEASLEEIYTTIVREAEHT